jgi:hypothetical protein
MPLKVEAKRFSETSMNFFYFHCLMPDLYQELHTNKKVRLLSPLLQYCLLDIGGSLVANIGLCVVLTAAQNALISCESWLLKYDRSISK